MRSKSLGNLVALERSPEGASIITDFGSLQIEFIAADTVRLQAWQSPQEREFFSYAVIEQQRSPFDLKWSETAESLQLSTEQIHLQVQKNPVRLKFYDATGTLLNEDEPAFGISWIGTQTTVYKKLQPRERFIGLGEKTGNLDRRGSGFTHWNTDFFGYGTESDPLYATLPFYIGILPESHRCYGIFMDSPVKSHFNFGASNHRFASFTVEEGPMNYYFFAGTTVADIIKAYCRLTGTMPLPPKWSLGLHQSRYSYYPEEQVLLLAQTFRSKQIPADAIHLDIHYMEGYKIFTWDSERFPHPAKLIAQLQKMGFHVVVICDPGIKVEQGYSPYEEGMAREVFVKYPDGSPYCAQVWPGWCHFPDFTNPNVRQWWGEKFADYVTGGVEGFWNDMNEPATWGQKLPDLVEFNYEGQMATARKARNVYGMQMARATCEGVKTLMKGKRPFVLTRAAYAGIQRYAALWTGDNTSSDEHMLLSARMICSIGLAGVPFAGCDIGGFIGVPTPALFARWIAQGAFMPFFRCHTMINTPSQEPWSFGEEVEAIARNYINLRYQLLPYLYSLFYQASQNGLPIARTLALEHPYEDRVYLPAYQNQYFFGPFLMVCPTPSNQYMTKVFLPPGKWFYLYNDSTYEGNCEILVESPLEFLPVFVKAGAIIPMQSIVQHVQQPHDGTLYLHVYYHTESSDFVFYEDDGESYNYEKGIFYRRVIVYQGPARRLILEAAQGNYPSSFTALKLILHGFNELFDKNSIQINGQPTKLITEEIALLAPLPNFDPLGKPVLQVKQRVLTAIIPLISQRIIVEW
ncbi:MAG: glycoside hydrolase family 31 protein [Cytophagales bacterium]|nr:DUF4968 domain-containing protein [Bernardetiaceae bacterium]MDW8211164.1 glycoside hydrolase family 31 protein [Cytophagales bacterium]